MLTPGLACDWIVGGTPQARAALAELEHPHYRAVPARDVSKLKLFKDYSKAYLFKSVHKSGIHKPLVAKAVFLAASDAPPARDFIGGGFSIRGPPPDDAPPPQTPILLSTLRFRE